MADKSEDVGRETLLEQITVIGTSTSCINHTYVL